MDEMSERSLHGFDDDTEQLAHRILDYVIDRIRMSQPPLDAPRSPAELAEATGETVTDDGLGWEHALALFCEVLAPACISSDHPRYLGFVPTAPAEAATLFNLVVSASSIYGDWWIEGAGAIHAENQALRWLAGLAGLPETAGGVFLSGGPAGNLTATTVARETRRKRRGRDRVAGVACATSAHSSIMLSAKVIDVPVVLVEADERGRLTGERLAEAIARADVDVFAAFATGGATNTGVVDDLDGVATVCHERDVWMHVDAAYGGAAMAAPSARQLFPATSSGPTRSSSTPTSGCSHPSTAPRSCTGTRTSPALRSPSRPATSRCSPRPRHGTRRISRST
jgi:glutamate/tyrosine decarboxylase-like PLP-dependent enzyme